MSEFLQSLQGFVVSAAAFVFALGVIIAIHEWGHLVMAKLFDVKVHAFSIGFGPRIWGFQRGETEYKVAAIPLGGYVKLAGEEPDEATEDPRDFLNKPRWQRILVYLAGPAMNVFLALLLMAVVFMVGIESQNLAVEPEVGFIAEGSSAEAADLEVGDMVVSLDGKRIDDWDDLSFELATSWGEPLELTVERDGETFTTTVTPQRVEGQDFSDLAGLGPAQVPTITMLQEGKPAQAAGLAAGDRVRRMDGRPVAGTQAFIDYVSQRPGEEIRLEVLRDGRPVEVAVVPEDVDGVGRIGVGIGVYQRYGFFQAMVQSARFNWNLTEKTVVVLGRIFTREASAKANLAGPIQIAVITGEAAQLGFKWLLQLMAMISVSIALLNLMPIPMLDGGQITILLVESTMRRDLSLKVKEMIAQVGFVLIILLMLTVIYFDLVKTLPGLFS